MKINDLKINVKDIDVVTTAIPAVVVNLFKGVKSPSGATGAIDQALDGAISQLIKDGEIKGGEGEVTLVHTLGKIAPSRVVVAGLGSKDKFDSQVARRVSADVVRFLRRRGISKMKVNQRAPPPRESATAAAPTGNQRAVSDDAS